MTFFPFMTAIDALVTTLTTFPENEAWSSDEVRRESREWGERREVNSV